ncbi:hypothetical protein CPT03_02155 [Pedobacter ginsengisoli]|uniref:Import component protein n=1 Tax=Pedobacter ginsengisoli TaxID=363852 RepID=A0A2D1U150_9SPHI|nr:hypothetical protein [Pedobacter ginsengisoli]ATP55348.1 hypothetical protein CPT03_02155 [Pedobacter ginsengisoli]
MNTEQTHEMDKKTIAIISYLTIIGWVIAYIQLSKNKAQLAIFHIRQSLFLMLCAFVIFIIQMLFVFVPYVGWIISIGFNLITLGFLVLWVIALINAINGEQKPLPIFGNKAQDLLKGIK